MKKIVEHFAEYILSIRSGVITPKIAGDIKINYHGQKIPIKALATVTGCAAWPGIAIIPYEWPLCGTILTTIEEMGYDGYINANAVMVSVPKFTTETDRQRTISMIRRFEEEAKVAIRNIRKKERQKLSGSQDEVRRADKELQATTDKYISEVGNLATRKVEAL
jgi:ribosome recycling factor